MKKRDDGQAGGTERHFWGPPPPLWVTFQPRSLNFLVGRSGPWWQRGQRAHLLVLSPAPFRFQVCKLPCAFRTVESAPGGHLDVP